VALPGGVAAGLAMAALLLAGTAAALLVAALLIAIPEHYRYRARRRSAAAPAEDRGADETRTEDSATPTGDRFLHGTSRPRESLPITRWRGSPEGVAGGPLGGAGVRSRRCTADQLT
jgi:hypothetical protein